MNTGDETNESPEYDPRPGNVNVFLPYIEFDENVIADFIEEYHSRPLVPIKAKNILSQIIKMFRSITVKFNEILNDLD